MNLAHDPSGFISHLVLIPSVLEGGLGVCLHSYFYVGQIRCMEFCNHVGWWKESPKHPISKDMISLNTVNVRMPLIRGVSI